MSTAPLTLRLSAGGVPVDVAVLSIRVRHGSVARAEVVIADLDPVSGDWPVTDSTTFSPGAALRIEAGWGTATAAVFEGTVVRARSSLTAEEGGRLTLTCQGAAVPAAAGTVDLAIGQELTGFEMEIDPATGQLRGRFTCVGSALVHPGASVRLVGVARRHAGILQPTSVEHVLTGGSWTTEAAFGPEATDTGRLVIGDDGSVELGDANGNTLRLSSSGVSVTASSVSVTSSGDLTARGMNVRCEADMSLTASGGVNASLLAGAVVTVKGSLVEIN